MKTVRDACQLQPNALSIQLGDQIEQLDEYAARRTLCRDGTGEQRGWQQGAGSPEPQYSQLLRRQDPT